MRDVRVNLNEVTKKAIDIGYVGEKNHTRVILLCASLFNQYPSAVASMVVKSPTGALYPVVLTRDNNFVIWSISENDLARSGGGQFQITFTNNNEIIKQAIGSFSVKPSLIESGDPPDPIETWIDEANELLAEFEQDLEGKLDSPSTAGTLGQVLTSDGEGGQSWEDISAGTIDYTELENKPKINSVALTGNKSLSDLGIHNSPSGGASGQILKKASATDYDTTWANYSYTDITNKPQINNVTLTGNKSLTDLGMPEVATTMETQAIITEYGVSA